MVEAPAVPVPWFLVLSVTVIVEHAPPLNGPVKLETIRSAPVEDIVTVKVLVQPDSTVVWVAHLAFALML